jgi:hypothetical protein
MNRINLGVWLWGGATMALAFLALFTVLWAGWNIESIDHEHLKYQFRPETPEHLAGIFYALKENGSLVAGILGFSGLAWAHFFKASNGPAGGAPGEDEPHAEHPVHDAHKEGSEGAA